MAACAGACARARAPAFPCSRQGVWGVLGSGVGNAFTLRISCGGDGRARTQQQQRGHEKGPPATRGGGGGAPLAHHRTSPLLHLLQVDLSRYLYMPVLNGFRAPAAEDDKTTPSAMYKRYKLSEEKNFSSFFHPDKAPILGLIDQFTQKKGKFSIPGYPQKVSSCGPASKVWRALRAPAM